MARAQTRVFSKGAGQHVKPKGEVEDEPPHQEAHSQIPKPFHARRRVSAFLSA